MDALYPNSLISEGLSPYHLTIDGCRAFLDVLRFRGRESFDVPFSWKIDFTTLPSQFSPTEALLKRACFRLGDEKVVYGVITECKWLGDSQDQSHYRVRLTSRLSLLSHHRQCAVYQNQSVPELVELILRRHGFEGADFEFALTQNYPSRELITQWQESDLKFIQRLLSEVGIWFYYGVDTALESERLYFSDSPQHYQFDIHLPYRPVAGLSGDDRDFAWGIRAWSHLVTGGVQTKHYNPMQSDMPMDSNVSSRHEQTSIGSHYRYGESFLEAGDELLDIEVESGAFYAKIHHERELTNSSYLHVSSNTAQLSPGKVLELHGCSIPEVSNGMLITQVTYRGSREMALQASVWGIPYQEWYCYRPRLIKRPVINGTLPARIESRWPNDIYSYLDEFGRYRVKLDFDRAIGESGYGYVWLRLAKPYSGEHFGLHTPLINGTEVAIGYHQGDIDQPYIAHALHDSQHADVVTSNNHTRNVLKTASDNLLQMEDKRGEEHITQTTIYGATQLNQGHLVDARLKRRGEGVELRTDEYGSLRASKGLFISSDVQIKASGETLDMSAALREIDWLVKAREQLEQAAKETEALQADIESQKKMFEERLTPLNEVVHFSAPQGVAFSSGEHTQLTASDNVAINAGGNIDVGVMGRMSALSGEELGLFSRSGQLSMISNEGPISMQSQTDDMSLTSESKLYVRSGDDIDFTGKKRITLIGGGSYLKLENGKIEYGSTGDYLRKVGQTTKAPANTISPTLPTMGKAYIYSAIFQLLDSNGKKVSGEPYRIITSSGRVITGLTDKDGYSFPIYTNKKEDVELQVFNKKTPLEEKMWYLGSSELLNMGMEYIEDNISEDDVS